MKPRVVSPETREVVLLEDVIESHLANQDHRAIELVGERGTGKSTALAHLMALDSTKGFLFLDEPQKESVQQAAESQRIIYATRDRLEITDLCYELAPWTSDDVIEYLLATHPHECATVMSRLLADDDHNRLEGSPALYCMVAEELAGDPQITTVRDAMRKKLVRLAGNPKSLRDAQLYALFRFLRSDESFKEAVGVHSYKRFLPPNLNQLPDCRFLWLLLAADQLTAIIKERARKFPDAELPLDLIDETARRVSEDRAARVQARRKVEYGNEDSVPALASVLHRCPNGWRPPPSARIRFLRGGSFPNAKWDNIDQPKTEFSKVDLRHAELRDANLEGARFVEANLAGACLDTANLANCVATQANFNRASLSSVNVSGSSFVRASFVSAILHLAYMEMTEFSQSDLSHAKLQLADLSHCVMHQVNLDETDLRDASLVRATIDHCDFATAELSGADFRNAHLVECNWEAVSATSVSLEAACLKNCHLTGSRLPGLNGRHAKFRNLGLADIEWERADLRHVDFSGSSFHLGSTRSGLVGSPYPGHGTRTGFYTNDFDDQTYKAPEQIRKANLCGADLRGAIVHTVDFYLVDLRGAKYDALQAEHFRRCDAIL